MPDLAYLVRASLGIPDYWHPHLELQTDFLSGEIGRYPITMDPKADYPGDCDAEGLPIVYWGPGRTAAPSPVNIVLFGLGSHDALLASQQRRYREQFETVLNWLERTAAPLGDGVAWFNEVDVAAHNLKAPWTSGITQGLALSLLVRAQRLGYPRAAELARWTWLGFQAPISDGGFTRPVDGGVIFEEYPGPELDCVLNGAIAALIGLWEAWQSDVVPEAEGDFSAGVEALSQRMPLFDLHGWSLYSLSQTLNKPFLASPYYHRTNALLSKALGLMTELTEFHRYGDRWLATSASIVRRLSISVRIGLDRFARSPGMLQRDKSKR